MEISKSRLKEIIEQELLKLNEGFAEIEDPKMSKIDHAYELALQLEKHINPKDSIGLGKVRSLAGVLAEISEEDY